MLVAASVLVLWFGSSCIRWDHVDPFAAFPIQLGGWVLAAWSGVVTALGLLALWRRRFEPGQAFVITLYALVWLAAPTLLLALARFAA